MNANTLPVPVAGGGVQGPIAATDDAVKRTLARYTRAKATWTTWSGLWRDCYTFTLPGRASFDNLTQGQSRTLDIYDETAVVGLQEFASKICNTMLPNGMRWLDLRAGRAIPPKERERVNRELADVTEYAFEVIHNSNFSAQAQEAMLDCGIGTGLLSIEPGDWNSIVMTRAVPMAEAVLDVGPFNINDAVFSERSMRVADIRVEWPGAELPRELVERGQSDPSTRVKILSATERDWTVPGEYHNFRLIWLDGQRQLLNYRFAGIGSSPWVPFSWTKSAGETYGRGPVLNALSAIKTANLTVQLILENADVAVSGLWQSDNPDILNTDTVRLLPGTILPKQQGSAGLEGIETPARFDVAQLILDEMRQNIKRALYVDQFAPLNQTPMSATEVQLRQADLADRIGSAYGRLENELAATTLRRVLYILQSQGRITLPRVDGREVQIVPVSPLARQQRASDVLAIDRYLGQLNQYFGPEMTNILIKGEEAARILGELHGVPLKMIRSDEERQAMIEQLKAAAAQGTQAAGQAGMPVA
jgi:hypothetical protein